MTDAGLDAPPGGPRLDNPLCVALDVAGPEQVRALAGSLEGVAGCLKVGLTAFTGSGPGIVRELAAARPVFLDLKLHDIPEQVQGAVAAARSLGAAFLTVHVSGGPEMLKAAAEAAGEDMILLGVTVLTSLGAADLERIGLTGTPQEAVLRLAEVALAAGVPGLVCAPHEVGEVRREVGARSQGGPWVVVPGVRPAGAAADDQRRTAGPREALEAGADMIVVGRPITSASDPAQAARTVLQEIL
ncbi:MAG TPA: orotidine-5'-phosphate decarboxylase [Actinomycetota bacterium]|nr:orotidine-5'-phosphate decarboxylase [Actinomycetota bacterium]